MTVHIALLRAINLGPHNKVAMADLRAMLTDLGFGDVRSLLKVGARGTVRNWNTVPKLADLARA